MDEDNIQDLHFTYDEIDDPESEDAEDFDTVSEEIRIAKAEKLLDDWNFIIFSSYEGILKLFTRLAFRRKFIGEYIKQAVLERTTKESVAQYFLNYIDDYNTLLRISQQELVRTILKPGKITRGSQRLIERTLEDEKRRLHNIRESLVFKEKKLDIGHKKVYEWLEHHKNVCEKYNEINKYDKSLREFMSMLINNEPELVLPHFNLVKAKGANKFFRMCKECKIKINDKVYDYIRSNYSEEDLELFKERRQEFYQNYSKKETEDITEDFLTPPEKM